MIAPRASRDSESLAGDNLTEALRIVLVAGDDGVPDFVEDSDVVKRPIHRNACSVSHVIERYGAVVLRATQVVNDKQMRSLYLCRTDVRPHYITVP